MRNLSHPSESDFVSYLSNELGSWRRGLMHRHLDSCWVCRCRLDETEALLRCLVGTVQQWPAHDADATRRAKAQFRRRVLAEEPLANERPEIQFRGWKFVAVWTGAAAALILLVSAVATTLEDPLRRARNAEARQAAEATIRQEFELALGRTDADQNRTRIELISDRRSGRFAVNWRNQDGSLIYGLWRPSASRVLAYRAAEQTGLRPVGAPRNYRPETTTFPKGAGIEKAIAEWLEYRELQPIWLARDGFLTSKLGDLGAPAQVEQENGKLIMRWNAAEPYKATTLLLQLDAGTFLPISQTLQADSSTVRLKIKLLSQGPVNSSSLDSRTFEPSPLLVMARALPPPAALPGPYGLLIWGRP